MQSLASIELPGGGINGLRILNPSDPIDHYRLDALGVCGLGQLVSERAGVLALASSMMIMGAVVGFAVVIAGGGGVLGFAAAAAAGALMAALFGFLTLILYANAVATGLALTLFGLGLSALVGAGFVGLSADKFPQISIPVLSDLPVIGPLLFGHDIMVYLSLALAVGLTWFFKHTRAGLIVRAVGDDHDAAHSIGYNVTAIRFMAACFGGAMAGIGGAYLSIVQTPLFVENMTAGRGWIALALVVFASWRPGRECWVPTCLVASPSFNYIFRDLAFPFPHRFCRCCRIWRPLWC